MPTRVTGLNIRRAWCNRHMLMTTAMKHGTKSVSTSTVRVASWAALNTGACAYHQACESLMCNACDFTGYARYQNIRTMELNSFLFSLQSTDVIQSPYRSKPVPRLARLARPFQVIFLRDSSLLLKSKFGPKSQHTIADAATDVAGLNTNGSITSLLA